MCLHRWLLAACLVARAMMMGGPALAQMPPHWATSWTGSGSRHRTAAGLTLRRKCPKLVRRFTLKAGNRTASQVNYRLTATVQALSGTRVCGPLCRGSPIGTARATAAARRALLPDLGGRPVLRAAGARARRLCPARRLRGGGHLQGDRIGDDARPGRASQGAGPRPAARDRRGAGDGAVPLGPQHYRPASHSAGAGSEARVAGRAERDGVRPHDAAGAHDHASHNLAKSRLRLEHRNRAGLVLGRCGTRR